MDGLEFFDDDGYPTEEVLTYISEYDPLKEGYEKVFNLVETLWSYPEFIEKEETKDFLGRPIRQLSISTGGWSGNESIIRAIESNWILHVMSWYSSKRGGHYVFWIPLDKS